MLYLKKWDLSWTSLIFLYIKYFCLLKLEKEKDTRATLINKFNISFESYKKVHTLHLFSYVSYMLEPGKFPEGSYEW